MPATVADLIVKTLADAGVRAIFGVPGGGGNLDVIDAAGRAGLPFVLTATETGGAIAAIAQAEITGRPGACLTTLGPGAASVTNGVACAFLDRAPILIFSDSYPAALRHTFDHQQLDHAALFGAVTKRSVTLAPRRVTQLLAEALSAAAAPPAGPVHVDCPGDVASAPAEQTPWLVREPAPVPLSAFDVSRLETIVERARQPLVIVGLGARRAADADAIQSFCTRHGVPAMVTYKAKGVVPDDHPCFAGVFTNAAIERPIVDQSDLVIGVGLDPVELLPRPWTHRQSVVGCGPWTMSAEHVPFAVQVVADVAAGLGQIEPHLPPAEWDLRQVRKQVDEQREKIRIPAGGLTADEVVRVAAARLASLVRVTVDAGAHMFPATLLWPVREPNGLLISNGLSTMGFALPAAIGAAVVDRERPVVALTGDGGLLMCAAELLTAARERLRVITIVFNDQSLSLIEIKQQARQFQPAAVDLGAVDWSALARSVGVTPFVATDAETLDKAIDQALAVNGPSLIDARVDRSNYGAMLKVVRGT